MGIFDNIVNSAETTATNTVENRINTRISKNIPGGTPATPVGSKCPKCSAPLPSPWPRFCPKCGAKLTVTCPKCNKDYPFGTKFCTDDGTKLSA